MTGTHSVLTTDDLIGSLVEDARPVQRLYAPGLRFAIWLAAAALIAWGMVSLHGARMDLDAQAADLRFQLELGTALLTGLSAAFAAFMLALPDRSVRWMLLPVPALAAWLATIGGGCYADFIRYGSEGLSFGHSVGCFQYIVETGVLMALPLAFMLRHARRIRPVPVAILGGLAVATLASAVLTLFHDQDTAMMVLIWHGGATLAVCLVCLALRGPAFLAAERIMR